MVSALASMFKPLWSNVTVSPLAAVQGRASYLDGGGTSRIGGGLWLWRPQHNPNQQQAEGHGGGGTSRISG